MSPERVLEEFAPGVQSESEIAHGIRYAKLHVEWLCDAVAAAENIDPLLSRCLGLAVAGAFPQLDGWVWWSHNQRTSPEAFTLFYSPSPEQQSPAKFLAQGDLQRKTMDFRCFFACNRLEEIGVGTPLRKVVDYLKELFGQLDWSEDPPPLQE